MSQPDLVWVDSSNIEAIGYDRSAGELWVQFIGGRTYIYTGVPEFTYESLLNADSKGSFFNREIKPNYGFRIS